jgi:ferritin-like metal-binding protein YciE
MPKDPKETFLMLLSDVRQNTDKWSRFYQEAAVLAQDQDVKEILESRGVIAEQTVERLDRCFNLLGQKPVKVSGRLADTFIEDFRKEAGEIQSLPARKLFILAKITHLVHARIGEYVVLTAAADLTGNPAVGVLIESCLADRIAFAERTRRLIRNIAETRMAERLAA